MKTGRFKTSWLLMAGILSSVTYVGADLVAAMRYPGYEYANQAVSELFAIGVPTRPFIVGHFSIFNILTVLFGAGVLGSAGSSRSLRIAGWALILYALIGQVTLLFFPMHMRGAGLSLTDTMHKAMTGALVLCILVYMSAGAFALRWKFRIYTVATVILLTAFGIWAGNDTPNIEANLSTPWLGIKERVNIYLTMLWVAVLSITLMKAGLRRNLRRPAGKKGR